MVVRRIAGILLLAAGDPVRAAVAEYRVVETWSTFPPGSSSEKSPVSPSTSKGAS